MSYMEYYFGNFNKTKSWKNPLIKTDDKCVHLSSAPRVVIPSEIFARILGMTLKIDTEFTLCLEADLVDNAWVVKDFKVPEQEVTDTSVEIKEDIACEGIYHSHVNMSASFSSTDDDYANNSHNFSIVGNKKGELSAVAMIDLPCGTTRVVPAKVEIEIDDMDVAVEKIKTKTPITYTYQRRHKRSKKKEYSLEMAIERWFRKNGLQYYGYDAAVDAYTGMESTYPFRSYIVYDHEPNEREGGWSENDIVLHAVRRNGVVNIEEVKR